MAWFITRLRESLRDARRRIASWYVQDEPTNAQLGDMVRNMELVSEMIKHPGWKVYCDAVLDRIDDQIDSTMLLPPEKFASVTGVEAKGIAMGARMALNVSGEIISRGFSAEKKLKERLRKANAKSSRPTAIRVGMPLAER